MSRLSENCAYRVCLLRDFALNEPSFGKCKRPIPHVLYFSHSDWLNEVFKEYFLSYSKVHFREEEKYTVSLFIKENYDLKINFPLKCNT